MWQLWLGVGWAGWALTIFASGSMNYLSGYGFGRNDQEALVLGLLGIAADGWKSLGPIFILALYRARRPITLTLASIVWLACFSVAITSAVGLVAKNRSAMTGKQDALRTTHAMHMVELNELLAKRGSVASQRSSSEIKVAIDAVLSRPIWSEKRLRGTVGSMSDVCAEIGARTAAACVEVATLRQELAAIENAERIDQRIAALRSELLRLQQSGASLDSDPQADLIARLTGDRISASDVPTALVLLIVLMVEVVSAFTPIVLSEYAATAGIARQATSVAVGRDRSGSTVSPGNGTVALRPIGDVHEYMADRIRPAEPGGVAGNELYADYVLWCTTSGRIALPSQDFLDEFKRICQDELHGKVRLNLGHYQGCKLAIEANQIANHGRQRLAKPAE